MSRNSNSNSIKSQYCKVCQDSGKSKTIINNHCPGDKDNKGNLICPTLANQECRFCFAKGHTPKYCPEIKKKEQMQKNEEHYVRKNAYEEKKYMTTTTIVKKVIKKGSFAELSYSSSSSDEENEDEEEDKKKKQIKKQGQEQQQKPLPIQKGLPFPEGVPIQQSISQVHAQFEEKFPSLPRSKTIQSAAVEDNEMTMMTYASKCLLLKKEKEEEEEKKKQEELEAEKIPKIITFKERKFSMKKAPWAQDQDNKKGACWADAESSDEEED